MPLVDSDVSSLCAKTVKLRLVEADDAEYIVSLRIDGSYNKYLSPVSESVAVQRAWLENYKKDETAGNQYYFIIERVVDGCRCGTVRVYDFVDGSFSWGSWILDENKTTYAAIEVALLVYKFGFDVLEFESSHFEVMRENRKVVSFHEKLGAEVIREDDSNFYFIFSKKKYQEVLLGYARFLA